MPNHVANLVRLCGPEDAIEQFLKDTIKTNEEGEEYFDFNAIIPMPESLNTDGER